MSKRSIVALSAIVLLAGCSSGHSQTSPGDSSSSIHQEQVHPTPPGRFPDKSAQMICSRKLEIAVAKALGISASITKPTWSNDLYSCNFDYPTGSINLSLKELGSRAATVAYFEHQKSILGTTGDVEGLGDAAFQPPDGSMVVRKAWGVLDIDVAGLPATFGIPPTARSDVSYTVADLIVACWAGD